MKRRYLSIICVSALLAACVRQPVFKDENHAFLRSNYPITMLNGQPVEPAYRMDIPAGDVTAVIVYHTYRHDHVCTFSWVAEANTVYEVTSQWNSDPLTLYRWVRINSLWASRLDPAVPLDCRQQPRSNVDSDA